MTGLSPGITGVIADLRCPATGMHLREVDGTLATEDGRRRYPICAGIPLLLAEERSLFDVSHLDPSADAPSRRSLFSRVGNWLSAHALSRNVGSEANYRALLDLLEGRTENRLPRVLVVGGQIAGVGLRTLLEEGHTKVIETDVELGPRTQIVCDVMDLPFRDSAFDAVVCQAVLEHVVDPYRAASEIHRVLRPDGLVYSEIPFMQQVHGGVFDFTRFTHLGHRRLWRGFDEIRSGAQGGPGMALGWSAQYLLLAIAGERRIARAIARLLALGLFWLKYLDDVLVLRPGGLDAASGTFFLGSRRDTPLADRDVVQAYRGVPPRGQRMPRPSSELDAASSEEILGAVDSSTTMLVTDGDTPTTGHAPAYLTTRPRALARLCPSNRPHVA